MRRRLDYYTAFRNSNLGYQMIKIGSEFLRKTNNKETMQILELICHSSLGYTKYFKLLREYLAVRFIPLKLKPTKITTKKTKRQIREQN